MGVEGIPQHEKPEASKDELFNRIAELADAIREKGITDPNATRAEREEMADLMNQYNDNDPSKAASPENVMSRFAEVDMDQAA